MAQKRTYLQEAYDYHEQRMAFMAARVPRSLIVKGTTLLALGAQGSIQLMAACAAAQPGAVTRKYQSA
jgi:hypothetical protein